jgi:hypothetical protein
MRHTDGFSPRIHTYIRTAARIVLLAIIVQLAAPDHWQRDVASVVGIEGTQAHAQHCHGAASSCADSQGAASALPSLTLTPAAPQAIRVEFLPDSTAAVEALASAFEHPPRHS